MKTYCKHSRITEPAFVRDCIERFLKGKRPRRDVNEFLSRHPDLDSLSRQIADEIGRGEYRFAPIRYFRRVEPISGKIRIIGRESIRHQIYDYVCGTALMPLFRAKVGRWQTASIPGRGIADARRAIKQWAREPSSKVFVKLDVRKCYPSISREVLKRLLSRDVGDRRLLDLTFHLIDQYAGDDGLNIGSYLSQWLANYYLSYAYHYCERHLSKERVNRRTGETATRRLVTHLLFYMDDVLLLGRSKRDLSIAARRITAFAHDRLKLEMHPEWNIKHVGVEPIDMVGYVFRPGRTNIRTGIFLRAGRTFARFRRHPRNLTLARRCVSYYGYFIHSDSVLVRRRRQMDETMRMAKRTLARANQQPRKEKKMSKLVTSATPLEKVEYFRRGDGLADIWLREDIRQVQRLGTDGTESTEYTAQETYLCRDLTEQEAVEQFDGLIRSAEIESMDDKERIAQLEQQTVDNATAIAAFYEAQATAVSADTEGKE
jgi:hypothetical protein